ncbi:methylmalonyl-CoA mutase family protein [Bacillus sp. FSL K6-3431]|uniref:methylmalonyl-CoA mutase family protein n=1 Tax=Bacillus sp. FSL K6-3431 TaxID=2921500 RepID=UPI0030FB715A
MSIEEAITISFKSVSFNKWKEIAEKTVRGKSIDSLSKQTCEGIKLSPLYTSEHLDSIEVEQFPGIGSTIRGSLKADTNIWKIAQVLEKRNWEDLKSDIVMGIKNGQETISFDADILSDIHRLNFMELRKVIDFNVYPLFIISKTNFHEVALKLLQSDGVNISGVMGKDLLSSDLHNGFLFKPTSNLFNNWLETVEKLNKHCDHLRTIVIDVTSYQSSGASAIQELGIAISEAVFYIEKMQEYGWDPIKTIQKIVFQFSIGGQFFIETAKLRAFKKLWKMISTF